MRIILTLEEVLDKCNDWEQFCNDKGWNEWAVNEGGGDIQVSLTEDEANKYGILKNEKHYD